jgi:hypothetical protein
VLTAIAPFYKKMDEPILIALISALGIKEIWTIIKKRMDQKEEKDKREDNLSLQVIEELKTKITDLGGITTIFLSFVSLSILAEVIFGIGVFGTSVVTNVMGLIKSLGDGGFVGVIALIILIQLFQNKK